MNQRHRIFIAINLPEDIKKKLADFRKNWPELPMRWTKPNNIHITLAFIGYVNNEELLEICKVAKEVAQKHSSFFVNLNKICYGPPPLVRQAANKKPPRPPKFSETVISEGDNNGLRKFGRPRMVWAVGEKSSEFASLKDNLDKFLSGSQNIGFSSENRAFSPHITLGRIKQWEWKRIEPEERPEVNEDINLSFSVDSIEIMESVLKRTGPEYTILESSELGK